MRNVLTVFIASPSDLASERQRAFEVVAEVNSVLRPIDWTVELLGWEDTLPGYGRPQALINRDVERCDLFIGAIWRRWGSPPAQDSVFTSGFEEEFSIAIGRRERTPTPEIWMFFKKVDTAHIADAGAQLQRVITFRESIVAGKTVLFKEFDSIDAWEKMLRKYLLQHVLDLNSGRSTAPEGPSEPALVATATSAPPEASSPPAPGAGDQLATLAQSLAPAFASGDLDEVTKALNNPDETAFLAVRALLLSLALVAASGTSASKMPTHELNTLYRYRERLRATDDELYLVFRTILTDESDVSPGWFWFSTFSARAITLRLLRIIHYDDDSGARAASFSVLRNAGIPIFPEFHESFLMETVPSLPAEVHDAAWAYLLDVVTAEDMKALGDARGTWLESRVSWLKTWLDAGRDLDQFLPKSPDPQLLSEPMKQLIAGSITRLSDASLGALSSMPLTELSDQAADEIAKRGITARQAGPRLRRRRNSLESLLFSRPFDEGTKREETDEERYDRLSRQTSDDLKRILDWYTLDGRTTYQLLAERGEISREIVRADIDNGFQRIRELSDQLLEEQFGPTVAAKFKQDYDDADLNTFIAQQFTEKAIAVLATDSTPEDIAIARQLLDNDRTRSAALEIIEANGDARDVERLLDIVRVTFGDDRNTALRAIRRWTTDRLATAKILIAAEGRDLRRGGLAMLREIDDSDALPFLEALISHEDEEIRFTAVALLRLRVDRPRLEELLRNYFGKGTYYYNVVAWLDRLLYAPQPMSDYYTTKLDEQLKKISA
jgi:hypothetical protein